MDIQLFVACKAFINFQGKLLVLRESSKYGDGCNAGSYDVPGGRVKPGESWNKGLIREVREETGLEIKIGQPFFVHEWRPIVHGERWQIVGIFFKCQTTSDVVILSDDHSEYLWIDPANFKSYPIIENMVTVFENYTSMKL